jgi:hypothetical protein
VAHQPDWSVLLGLLAQSLGEEIVLTSCKLESQPPTPDAPAPMPRPGAAAPAPESTAAAAALREPGARRYTLQISGIGRTQSSVSQFVLRLERLGLFERVTILKTARELFGEHDSIGFRLEATMGSGSGAGTEGAR